MSARDLDIVLYGATGFVGRLTAAHLAAHAGTGVRIALAGRSRGKLEALRGALGAPAGDWEVVDVDATDTEGLQRLAARSTAIASTVGPYDRHGRDLVRACAQEGTHYADLTGEVLFVRWSLDEVAGLTEKTGARIVHACGFDSVPSDLGVFVTASRAASDDAGTLGDTTMAVQLLRGGLSGGTIDSGRQQVLAMREDADARRTVADPYGLSPRRPQEPPTAEPADTRTGWGRRVPVGRDADTSRWSGPFLMASFNTRIVRLSNTLSDWSYGRGFRYREVTEFGSGPLAAAKAVGMALGLGAVLSGFLFAPTRAVLDRLLPRPGDGPGEAQRAAGRFRMEIRTTTSTGIRYSTTVGADHDPGYDGTAIMLGEAVLALALDGPRLPQRAGVLTPATALGDVLVERLRTHGFVFDVSQPHDPERQAPGK